MSLPGARAVMYPSLSDIAQRLYDGWGGMEKAKLENKLNVSQTVTVLAEAAEKKSEEAHPEKIRGVLDKHQKLAQALKVIQAGLEKGEDPNYEKFEKTFPGVSKTAYYSYIAILRYLGLVPNDQALREAIINFERDRNNPANPEDVAWKLNEDPEDPNYRRRFRKLQQKIPFEQRGAFPVSLNRPKPNQNTQGQ